MNTDPTPLAWHTLHTWLRRTRRTDTRHYSARPRAWSTRRLWHCLRPNLRAPIFVVGAPRSGTTLLGDSIGALPELSYHFEPPITKGVARHAYEGSWSQGKLMLAYRATYAWLMSRHADGDLRFAEKTPQNCFTIGVLQQIFSDAVFVHIIRDGRDCALSYSKRPWLTAAAAGSGKREPGGYLHGPYPRFWVEADRRAEFQSTSDLHRCIWAWRRHTESALEDLAKLDPTRCLEIRYESLVTDPITAGTRLLDFLGIGAIRSREALQKRLEEATPSSMGRWSQELDAQQIELIDREAGPLLRRLGYG